METLITAYKSKISIILTLTGVLIIALIVFLASVTLNVIEEKKYISDPRAATVSVFGEGSVLAIPDVAKFTFSVQYEAASVPEAQDEVTERVDSIVSFLKDEGIEDRYIKTVSYSTYPRYEWHTSRTPELSTNEGRERVFVGYEVIHTTEVTVKDMDRAGSFVGGVGDRGATNISGLSFSVEDEEELKREARKTAIEDAQTKARELAKDLGVNIVRIVDFSESRTSQPYLMKNVDMVMEDSGAGVEPSFEPGEEEIEINVQIRYEIR